MAEIPTGGAGGLASAGGTAPGGGSEHDLGSESASIVRRSSAAASNHEERRTAGAAEEPARPAGNRPSSDQEEAGPQLGAGGTSVAADPAEDDEGADVKRGPNTSTKAALAGAAVPAAGAAGQLMMAMMFLNWLKGLLMNLLAMAMNLWNLAMGLVLGLVKGVVGAAMSVGTAVSGAVGGAVSAAVAGATTFTAGGVAVVILVVSVVATVTDGGAASQRDAVRQQCTVVAQTALDKVDGSNGDVDAQTMVNAKTIYSVLSAWGMPDENIAGIIGNWDAESGIDPTSVQGDFSSPQAMTDAKQSEARNTDNGIGLGQWTFERNTALRSYAEGHSVKWWELATQLGFMVSPAEGGNASVVRTMIATSQGSPAEAAYYFHDNWERSADTAAMKARRAASADKWMGLFSGWTKDQGLADSILAQAGTTVTGANTARATAIRSDCRSAGAGAITAKAGGLSLDEAKALMEQYKIDGEEFLDTKYGAGGPGDCGYGKADNCVGFDTYFMNKFTSFDRYAPGNGIDQAGSIANLTGKTTTKTPSVYSVASGPGTGAAGHVMVVLGIEGDQAIIGEAACGTNHAGTRAYTRSIASITNSDWTFVDVSDLITTTPASA